jgi:hypothetical protein
MVEGKVEDGMGFRGSAIFSVWVPLRCCATGVMTLVPKRQAVAAIKTATHRMISFDYCLGQLRIIHLCTNGRA